MKRPIGITVLAFLNFVWVGFGTLEAVVWPPAVFLLPFTLFILFLGIGLWRLREWARIACVICAPLSIVGLVSLLVVWFPEDIRSGWLALLFLIAFPSWVLWYMFRPNVKQAFKGQAGIQSLQSSRG